MLLDLDDTIVDNSAREEAWEHACACCAPACDPPAVLAEINRIRSWFWSDPERHRQGRLDLAASRRHIANMALQRLGRDDNALADQIAERYTQYFEPRMTLYEGAAEVLAWLREQGCRLALVTNGAADAQRTKIDRFQLKTFFDLILIEGDLGFGKPDPRIYQRALGELSAAPEDAWMIGDNLEWDVAGPQRLGMTGIWIDASGSGLPPAASVRPDFVIRSIGELREHVS